MGGPKIPAALRSYQIPNDKNQSSINSPCCEGTTQLRSHTAAPARSNGSCEQKKKPGRVRNLPCTHITQARGDPELTALHGSHEPATGWEPKRWGARSSSARRGLSSLMKTKSWSEIPPELAIAGETPLGRWKVPEPGRKRRSRLLLVCSRMWSGADTGARWLIWIYGRAARDTAGGSGDLRGPQVSYYCGDHDSSAGLERREVGARTMTRGPDEVASRRRSRLRKRRRSAAARRRGEMTNFLRLDGSFCLASCLY